MKICIVGASGKLGKYMVKHALDRGYEVVGVCRERSVAKLEAFKGQITIIGGATNDRDIIERAVAGCDAVLVVLVPWGAEVPLVPVDGCARERPGGGRERGPTSLEQACWGPHPQEQYDATSGFCSVYG